jgi:hypothetical protein
MTPFGGGLEFEVAGLVIGYLGFRTTAKLSTAFSGTMLNESDRRTRKSWAAMTRRIRSES